SDASYKTTSSCHPAPWMHLTVACTRTYENFECAAYRVRSSYYLLTDTSYLPRCLNIDLAETLLLSTSHLSRAKVNTPHYHVRQSQCHLSVLDGSSFRHYRGYCTKSLAN